MFRVEEYGVVTTSGGIDHSTVSRLIARVAEKIKDGWQPCGGISVVTTSSGDACAYQAITRGRDAEMEAQMEANERRRAGLND